MVKFISLIQIIFVTLQLKFRIQVHVNNNTEREFLKRLRNSRIEEKKRMNEGGLDGPCFYGMSFPSLFEDINDSIGFQKGTN